MGYINKSKPFRLFMKYTEQEKITKDQITNLVIKDLSSRAERGYILII